MDNRKKRHKQNSRTIKIEITAANSKIPGKSVFSVSLTEN